MILALLMAAFVAGLDNLQAGAAVGLLPIPRRRLVHYALAFTAAETAAPLFGMLCSKLVLARALQGTEYLGPLVLIACAAAFLVLVWRRRDVAVLADRPGLAVALAAALSYDNFLLGLGMGSGGASLLPTVLATGTICGIMSCAGLFGAHRLGRYVPRSLAGSLALLLLGAHALAAAA